MLRTSQSGRISESGGRMRPAIALNCASGKPVTPASTRIGLPTPPHATGAVFATQTQRRGLKRVEAEPDQKRSGNRDRRATAARAFQKRAEAKGDQHELQPLVRRQRRNRILHHLKLSGRRGDVVEKDRGDDDPRDAHHSENEAMSCGRRHQHRGHLKHHTARARRPPAARSTPTPTRAASAPPGRRTASSTGRAETAVDSDPLSNGS